MFKVIEFQDNGLGIVRQEWMTPRKKECFWPPFKAASKFNKCLMTQLVADEKWPVYAVKRLMFETDDLLLAREKCKQAESESELISDAEQSKKKRKRKAHVIATDSSESEEAEEYLNYPSPPREPSAKSRKATSSNPLATEISLGPQAQREFRGNTPQYDTNDKVPSPKPYLIEKQNEPNSREHTPIARTYSGIEANIYSPSCAHASTPRFLLQKFNVDSPLSSRSPSATPKEKKLTAIDQINVSLELIGTYIADIQTDIKQIKATQYDILLRLSTVEPNKIALPDEIALPLKSIEDLNSIQIWLENQDNKQNLINNLSFVGGNTTATITRRILQRVFSTSLALQCNWSGKNNKYSLQKIRLTEVIINAVRRNKIAETATESEIKNALTSWFRFARDRDGGRESRRARPSQ